MSFIENILIVYSSRYKTFRGLYNKVTHVNGNYYTDKWQGFAKEDRHITGKSGTRTIERDNLY